MGWSLLGTASAPRKQGSSYKVDTTFEQFLLSSRPRLLEQFKYRLAPMDVETIYNDAAKYKYAAPNFLLEQDLLNEVVDQLSDIIVERVGFFSVCQPEKALSAMKLSTSSTFDGRFAGPTKAHLLAELISLGDSSTLADAVQWVEDGCHLPDASIIPLRDSLAGKDEIRPMEKLNKTRAFISPSIYSYVAQYSLFSDMSEKMMSASRHAAQTADTHWPFMFGVPVQRGGFNNIISKFMDKKFKKFADQRAWDGHICSVLFGAFKRLYLNCVLPHLKTPAFLQKVDNVIRMIYDTPTVFPDGSLRVREGGMPSGVFITLLANSIIDFLLFAYCYALEVGVVNLREMLSTVILMIIGDDLNCASDDNLDGIFSRYQQIGFEVTFEHEPSFCSHSIRHHKGVWYLEADGNKLASALYFKREMTLAGLSLAGQSLNKALSLLAEAYSHDNKFYESLIRDYIIWLGDRRSQGVSYKETTEFQKLINQYLSPEELEELVLGQVQGVVKATGFAHAPLYIVSSAVCTYKMTNVITADMMGTKKSSKDTSTKQLRAHELDRLAGGGKDLRTVPADRLASFRARILDLTAGEFDYLRCLLYPSETTKTGIPDFETSVRTVKWCWKNSGRVSTSATGDGTIRVFPNIRQCVVAVNGATTDYGVQFGADVAGNRSESQINDITPGATAGGFRRVGKRVTLRILTSATTTTGMFAIANLTPQPSGGTLPGTFAEVMKVPDAIVGTASELFKDGDISIPLLTAGASSLNSAYAWPRNYNPLAFRPFDQISDGNLMPSIVIAFTGMANSTPVLQLEVVAVYEAITNSSIVPVSENTGSIRGIAAAHHLANHPSVYQQAVHSENKSTPLSRAVEKPGGLLNYVGNMFKRGEEVGGEAIDIVKDAVDVAEKLGSGAAKVFPYIAPLLAL